MRIINGPDDDAQTNSLAREKPPAAAPAGEDYLSAQGAAIDR